MKKIGYQIHLLHGTQTPKKWKNFTNYLELLVVIWAVDRFKHYFLETNFIVATEHKALILALDRNNLDKTSQSRLTRWNDRLLPYQFKVAQIPGKDMRIVDYLSREPNGDPWLESELNENLVVTAIESFRSVLDCKSSRLNEKSSLNRNESVLEYSRCCNPPELQNTSSLGCYSNQNTFKWTRLNWSESYFGRKRAIKRRQRKKWIQ